MNNLKRKLLILFGYYYIINKRSKEIHNLLLTHKNCNLKIISKKNIKYIHRKNLNSLFQAGYNGCRWCYKSEDKG